ncbi:unnamed protein product [Paramecium sonneborni]|uniref:Uncharacterized protein n=1 Tax=Paramecium sonneborni TaxID=65129 RepID=A0A8S1LAU2_9CILI|nr:unnamed protein product [Paramecium sonneborni]
MFEQYSDNDTFICFEQQCHLSRIIKNWDQLKLHNQFNHKVISKQKFESKVTYKFNQFNQSQKKKMQEDIYQQIQYQEQRIIGKIQELFDFFQKMHMNLVEEQIYFDYQLSNSKSIESDIQNQIQIYYGQLQTPQQKQAVLFLDEIQSKLNLMENDFLNLLEKSLTIRHQYSKNSQIQKTTEFNFSTLPDIISQPIGIQENSYQTQLIQIKTEQVKNDIKNQFQHETHQIYDQNIAQEQFTLSQNQQIEQDDMNNIPLKGYKQFQQLQQNYSYPTENILDKDDERLKFQQASEIENTKKKKITLQKPTFSNCYLFNQGQQECFEGNNIKQQQQKDKSEVLQKSICQNIYIGRKFDLINSHKHLKFSENNKAFYCNQSGIGLVAGILNLEKDAQIRLKFSDSQYLECLAQIGIINVDKNGKIKGTQCYCLNEQAELISNEDVYQGEFKLEEDQDYLISYSSNKRMLYFIHENIRSCLSLGETQGQFKFYVKLYGLKVQILK